MHNIMDWNDYHYFLKVASLGSLNAAADALGVNHSTVFRRINALEARMDVRLFKRLKTGYVLTSAGEEILQRVQAVEDQMHAIQRKLLGKDIRLSGTLKISTTNRLGYYWLPPYIRRFKARYTDILIDVDIKTRYTNLTKREADIVIPAVNTQPDYMVGWKLAPILMRLYAAADYIDRHGQPQTQAELSGHRFLLPNEALAGLPADRWVRKQIPESAVVATSDKLTGLYHLARQGLGIAFLPHYVGESDDHLVKVMDLPGHCNHDVWILTHPDLRHTARVKAFMQFMCDETKAERRVICALDSNDTPASSDLQALSATTRFRKVCKWNEGHVGPCGNDPKSGLQKDRIAPFPAGAKYFLPLPPSSSIGQLLPHRHLALQVGLDRGDGHFAAVEDTGGQC